MARKWREFLTAWDDYRVEADEYRELDEERVLVALTAQGRGKASGLDIGATGARRGSATLFHLRAGKVTRLVPYFDRARALADVGLATDGDAGANRVATQAGARRSRNSTARSVTTAVAHDPRPAHRRAKIIGLADVPYG